MKDICDIFVIELLCNRPLLRTSYPLSHRLQTDREDSDLISKSLILIMKTISPNNDPYGTPLVTVNHSIAVVKVKSSLILANCIF